MSCGLSLDIEFVCLLDVDQHKLDDFVTHLYPIFDVVGSPSESDDDDGSARPIDDRLAYLCIPVDRLVSDSLSTAAQKERTSILDIANLYS